MTSTPSPSTADPNSTDDWLPVGTLVGAQGLKGELRLNPASDFPERFTEPGARWLQAKGSAPKEVELLEGRQLPGKSLYVVRLKGVNNRASAEALVGCTVLVPAED
ncbi:MAG: ribosome maturation factor RimM, partial [Proteobacteria bacterium]|nr:ribosome maturation factor RimM [Pseudomonadota bacterium]